MEQPPAQGAGAANPPPRTGGPVTMPAEWVAGSVAELTERWRKLSESSGPVTEPEGPKAATRLDERGRRADGALPQQGTGTGEAQPERGTGTGSTLPLRGTGTDGSLPEWGTRTDGAQPKRGTGRVAELAHQLEQAKPGTGQVAARLQGATFSYHILRAGGYFQGNETDEDTESRAAIFFWDEDTEISWLANQLSVCRFNERIGLVTCMPLSLVTEKEWKHAAKTCALSIFFHSKQSQKSLEDLRGFVEHCICVNESQGSLHVKGQEELKRSIGIFSGSAGGEKLFETLQNVRDGNGRIKEVRHVDISRLNKKKMSEEISRCSYSILHLTKERIDDMKLLSLYDIKKVLVVIDDLEDIVYPEGPKTLEDHPSANEEDQNMKPPCTVGIFFRSAPKDNEWLETLLRSASFRDRIHSVQSFCISNDGLQHFEQEVSVCTVGILYHTKNNGGINITDVAGSMYDAELQHLSKTLGKDNIFVVMDDLDDSSPEEKRRILEKQPSIGAYASDLLLIARMEKKDEKGLLGKLRSTTRRKLAIFYWETKTDISWIAPQLSVHHFDETIGLSITTDPNWRSEAKKASVIIFYHSKQSQKTEKDLQSFLCNCININEPQQNAEHSAKRSVGIFSRSAAGGRWGDTLRTLKSEINWMKEIRHTDISRIEELREEIAKCSYSILHFTKEHINDLKFLTQFEMKKVLVLIDDLEDCRPRTAGNKEIFCVNQEVFTRFPKEQPQNVIEPVRKPKFHGNVGIFSRSSAKDYEWLVTLLRSAAFSCLVKDVRPFVISNNRFLQFEEHISGCTTGILYHTKNRGGINITDVTSSLYDEELKTLASRLGKDNVFVLIDDLEDSGSGERRKILENQPSIVRFASDLLLITWKEKKDTNGLLQKLCFKYDKEETPALGMSRPTYVNVPEYLEVLP